VTTPREIEVKLELAPAGLAQLKKVPLLRTTKPPAASASEISVYFDTDKHKLHKKGLTLRVRRIGDRYIQTVKAATNGGLFERGEWESEIVSEQPDLSLARGSALEPLLGGKLSRQLKPMFETRVKRIAYPVTNNASAIALTVDHGRIHAGRRSAPLCEIELELERGDRAELFEVARELTQALPAHIAVKSKAERGYQLLEDKLGAPVKAAPIALVRGTCARDAFKMIGRACLKQAVGNEPALLAGDPEGVHQMRVGLRHLRAAMSLFAALLRDPQTRAVKAGLQWLAGELSAARELDVLLQQVVAPVMKRHARRDALRSLSQELAEQRAKALTRARDAVQSPRFRALTLEVAAWLEVGDWTKPRDDLVRDRGDLPVEVLASEQLRRRWKKIRKRGAALARLRAHRRHKLRIQVKKVRYACEFFARLFPGQRVARRRERFVTALERLQDGLGELNDIVMHEELMTAMGVRRRTSRKRAFAAGLLTGREDARIDAAMAAATQAYAKLARIEPYWT
jgi:triphosphatase